MFKELQWKHDSVILNDLVFRLQHDKNESWEGDENHFVFYKDKKLIAQYSSFFNPIKDKISLNNVVEIGMWDGGSAAFWNEILQPKKIVGIDILETGGGDYFKKYIKKEGTKERLMTYWSTDQTNVNKLEEIVKTEFGNEKIDLVFDDASHMYWPSLISFNTLFPHLAKGGLYIIEDWAWGHWKGHENNFPANTEPTKLIFELIEASANVGIIESVTVFSGFTVVKRGQEDLKSEDFNLKNYIYRRPADFKTRLKNAVKLLINRN